MKKLILSLTLAAFAFAPLIPTQSHAAEVTSLAKKLSKKKHHKKKHHKKKKKSS